MSSVYVLVVAAVIRNSGRVLAAKRLPGGAASGKWEFPGGKVEDGESPEAALRREITEELGLEIEVQSFLGQFDHPLDNKVIRLRCYWCTTTSHDHVLSVHSEALWCTVSELRELDWAQPDIPAVQAVLDAGASWIESR